jgi:hypothetical protein
MLDPLCVVRRLMVFTRGVYCVALCGPFIAIRAVLHCVPSPDKTLLIPETYASSIFELSKLAFVRVVLELFKMGDPFVECPLLPPQSPMPSTQSAKRRQQAIRILQCLYPSLFLHALMLNGRGYA